MNAPELSPEELAVVERFGIHVEDAIQIIARHIAASLLDDLHDSQGWDRYPEIGEYDFERVQEAVKSMQDWPTADEFRAAYEFLARRTEND